MQDLMRDFGNNDVNDSPENRARRAAFYGSPPGCVRVPDGLRQTHHRFARASLVTHNLCLLAVMVVILIGLVL
jgi:hypothetical protein